MTRLAFLLGAPALVALACARGPLTPPGVPLAWVALPPPARPPECRSVRPGEPTDHALPADVVAAMIGRRGSPPAPSPWVWLTRTGGLALHDVDVQWLAAAVTAYAEAGADLTMVVVTRRGWRDPRSGAEQTWVRLRGQ
mgnify:CR=1 FL=1